ncbi:ferrichrome ABC transporter ATP-binding protein [Xaviernesmea oryzae]|uniref:Ferrichrome ABC transporter ATP-binding protein n=1 Tax=Xaviernesmea oryzae TaxID=464029 RepID=A0A1Q9AYU1_9HYPH|nr:ABC transporter ATP-binding protein [Xaviernesmea oryzae]OLP60595.1 ferrichrome ABC transporter ATP-binding protein [Xaviernesmea oryzae]SEM32566.1 iron complex transport system ATP-binding protein [Xaviernesmea oryzae]
MLLACSKLTVTYGGRIALKSFDLTLQPGEVRALIGPNGSGKSTALQAMAGLLRPSGGRAVIDGVAVDAIPRRRLARQLAYLPQQPTAPDEMTVAQLVRQGRFAHVGLLRSYSADDEATIGWALESTGLLALADRPLRELSGGERQRAWISAAIAQEARILLLDEPTSFLDIGYQVEIIDLVYRLSRERGVSIVMAIHDLNQAMSVCDRISLLAKGETVFDGDPKDLAETGLIETVFRVRGTFVPIAPNAPPHFDVELAHRQMRDGVLAR